MADELNRNQRRRQRRRQCLIEAARDVITERGIGSLTVQDVTEAADVAVGSFYTYFSDKEELLEALIWDDLQRLGDVERSDLEGLTSLERAQKLLGEAYGFVEEHRALMRAVFGDGHSPEQHKRGLALIEARFSHGLAREPMIPPSDLGWLAALLAGMVAGGIRFMLEHPDVVAVDMTERTMRLITPLQDLYSPEG